MTAFSDLSTIGPADVVPGSTGRIVHGASMTLAVFELDPGTEIPERINDREQVGLCITGSITLDIDGERRELPPGGIWIIPKGGRRSAQVGPEGAVVVEIMSPTREDLRALETGEPRPTRWPGV